MGHTERPVSEDKQKETLKYANYITQTYSSLKATAKAFNTDKQRVHTCIRRYLLRINPTLYNKVKKIHEQNRKHGYRVGNRFREANTDGRRMIFENYICENLLENDFFTVYTRQVEEKFLWSRTETRRLFTWIASCEDSPVKIVNSSRIYGWYVFAIKSDKKLINIPDNSHLSWYKVVRKEKEMSVRKPKEEDKKLALLYANFIVNTFSTMKATANAFNVSPTYVEYRIYKILPLINESLYQKVKKISKQNGKEFYNRSKQANLRKGFVIQKQLEDYLITKLKDKPQIKLNIKELEEVLSRTNSSVYEYIARLTYDEKSDVILIDRNKATGDYTFKVKTSDDEECLKLKRHKIEANRKRNERRKLAKSSAVTTEIPTTEIKVEEVKITEVKREEDDNGYQIKWDF